jgi:Icc-related predicted phosphoesterase
MALASSRITTIAEGRKKLAYAALALMFALSPVTITLSMFYPTKIYTAIAWAMDVDLAIVLAGAIVGKSLLPVEENKKVTKKQPKATKQKEVQPVAVEPQPVAQVAKKLLNDDILIAHLAATPGQSQAQIADFFGVSHQAISKRMKKLYPPIKATK